MRPGRIGSPCSIRARRSPGASSIAAPTLVAQALRVAGVVAQGRVARIDKNSPEYFEVLFGAAKLNAVLVDVNWRLSPPEMAQIINDAEATVLFVGEEFLAHLDKIRPELRSVRTVVVHGEHPTRTLPTNPGWARATVATVVLAPPTLGWRPTRRTWRCSCTPRGRPACPRA